MFNEPPWYVIRMPGGVRGLGYDNFRIFPYSIKQNLITEKRHSRYSNRYV